MNSAIRFTFQCDLRPHGARVHDYIIYIKQIQGILDLPVVTLVSWYLPGLRDFREKEFGKGKNDGVKVISEILGLGTELVESWYPERCDRLIAPCRVMIRVNIARVG